VKIPCWQNFTKFTLTDVTSSAVAGRHVFLVTPTDGAAVRLRRTFAEIDDVTAIRADVTRIADHA